MSKKMTAILAVSTLLILGSATARNSNSAQGEVLEIQHGVSVPDQGEFDRLTIRTRNGETQRLLLGRSGDCPNCVMVGDRVRARVMAGDESGAARRVQNMQVRRTGERYTFRNEAGELTRERTRHGRGTGEGSAHGRGACGNGGNRHSGARRGHGGSGYHRNR